MSGLPKWVDKRFTVEQLAKKARSQEDFLLELLESNSSEMAQIKYKSAKILRHLSNMDPESLYPYWSHFVSRLNSDNTFLRSDAMYVIANLVPVDSENRFEKIFNKCFKQLDSESMIPAANLAGMSGRIALAKPELQTKIVNRLVKIDDTHHSSECKNIIKGKAIESFEDFYAKTTAANQRKIISFVKKESTNSRDSTRKKAEKFLKKWDM